ncbi:MAG: UvrD-helicase domain-containing protein, partial [Candidatus Competibacterales bacterium]|nr:UvrD-helicase domain-containing protein [Candidatus Competibacterales bacterium]
RAREVQVGNGADPGRVDEIMNRMLRLALLTFNQAPIGTIHGFCQRAAQDYAFSGGLELDPGSVGSGEPELQRIITKTWSAHMVDATPAWQVLADKGIGDFRAQIRELFRLPRQAEASLVATEAEVTASRNALGDFPGELPKEIAAGVAMLIEDPTRRPDAEFEKTLTRVLGKSDDPALTVACEQALVLARTAELGFAAYAEAFREIRRRMRTEAAELRLLTFDAIVEQFSERVLESPSLAGAIRDRHPWALIDEFQDTSYDQTRAFLKIWDHPDAGGLTMIGDPKQAIYGFRGGDVHAYLRAADHAENRATLPRNFRSVPDLLAALNRLFDEQRRPFLIDGLHYQKVKACSDDERKGPGRLSVEGRRARALTCWFIPASQAQSGGLNLYLDVTQAAVVAEIARLLERGSFQGRSVKASDIAVLVRRNKDALAMQRALGERGIDAACVNDASVFATEEAQEILAVLRAAASPGSEGLLRVALTTRLLGADRARLEMLAVDDEGWQALVEQAHRWHEQWRNSGVSAVLLDLIADAGGRVLQWPDGPRRMTNWLHLADLIQAAATGRQGTRSLLTWLERQLGAPDSTQESQKLRLETDADAVQIATIHRSKGLQYNIVFAPSLWWQPHQGLNSTRQARPTAGPFLFHDSAHQAHFDFGSVEREVHARTWFEESIAEDLRLTYVALTRARSKAYFTWGALPKPAWRGGLQWLLCDDRTRNLDGERGSKDDADLHGQVEARLKGQGFELLDEAPQELPARQMGLDWAGPALCARSIGRIDPDYWSLTSFTRLVSGQGGSEAGPAAEWGDDPDPPQVPSVRGSAAVFGELAGARFGEAVHTMFEELPAANPGAEESAEFVRDVLRRFGQPDSKEIIEAVQGLLERAVNTEFAPGVSLAGVDPMRRVAEMEFYLRLAPNRTAAFREFVVNSEWGRRIGIGREVFSHPLPVLEGVLNGFVDLIFEEGGRYYLVDYKTNFLGDIYDDYATARLSAAM